MSDGKQRYGHSSVAVTLSPSLMAVANFGGFPKFEQDDYKIAETTIMTFSELPVWHSK